ncbi:lipopolysaccharide biosynthesis protein [Aeromonas sp. QDB25]|uniref:lipopolysaccharide biosynthesis protein n=1 Tax=Aeromonas sp. QDB25 TaxID=2989832 RepID=UPI0022E57ED6|nr:hypothetical protein [Aeromonas sp. QDB25]
MLKKINKRWLPPLEQLMISGLSFFINGILILLSDKANYGQFSLLYSYVLLIIGVHAAIIATPMLVEASRESDENKQAFVANISRLLLASILFVFILLICFWSAFNNAMLIEAFVFTLLTSVLREYSRSIYLLHEQFERSISITFLYCASIVSGCMFCYWLLKSLTAVNAFFIIGAANVMFSLPHIITSSRAKSSVSIWNSAGRLWVHTRWALPGVVVIWLQNNAFLSIVSLRLGTVVAADLSSARLLIMPYMSFFSGYTRPLISQLSQLIESSKISVAFNKAKKLTAWQAAICGVMAIVFLACYAVQRQYGLFEKYEHLFLYGAGWAVFAGCNSARAPFAIFIQAYRNFKLLFLLSIVTAIISVSGVWFATYASLPIGVTFMLALSEIVLLVCLFWKVKRINSNTEPSPRSSECQ